MAYYPQYNGYTSEEWISAVTSAEPPEPPPSGEPADRRAHFNKLVEAASAKAMVGLGDKIRIQNHSFTTRDGLTLPARSYRPVTAGDDRLPVFYYIHGGGYLLGSLDMDDATCTGFALEANVVVVHSDYRHTPASRFPKPWDDSEDGFLWLHAHMDEVGGIADQVVVGGISAGAQLSASLVLRNTLGRVAPDAPPIAGQVLMVPALFLPDTRLAQLRDAEGAEQSSYRANEYAAMLSVASWQDQAGLLMVEDNDPRDLRINGGNATLDEVRGLPPTTIGVSGNDILRDEGLNYGKLLVEAG